MNEPINEKVSVISKYDMKLGKVSPIRIRWNEREYIVKHLDYYERRKKGRVIYHIFHVASESMYFRLQCDPETLFWTLLNASDGTPS